MDKMTSGTNSTVAGRGSRKSRGMDLRKALLVAHFLQDVRCAYIDEDYEIVANTIKCLKPNNCDNEITEITNNNKQNINKDIDERCSEESRTYLMDTDSPLLPSSSMFQSCVTNSDLMVSRISQVTQPLAISVNTNYVMSHQSDAKADDDKEEGEDEDCIVEEVPAFCEELEVSCEECNSNSDDVTLQNQEVTSEQQENPVNNSGASEGFESHTEVESVQQKLPCVKGQQTNVINFERTKPAKTITCPLPKKKRPLPKEFWDSDNQIPAHKSPKIKSDSCNLISNQFVTNSFTTSIANTVTLESKTSTSLSTVCSTIGSAPLLSGMSQKTGKTNPKVVVQITQSCNSFLPITCSQINLEKRLSEMTVRTF